jgi:hypothetical protein
LLNVIIALSVGGRDGDVPPRGESLQASCERSRNCAFRKFCGIDSGNFAASGVIMITAGELVAGKMLGSYRGTVEA